MKLPPFRPQRVLVPKPKPWKLLPVRESLGQLPLSLRLAVMKSWTIEQLGQRNVSHKGRHEARRFLDAIAVRRGRHIP